MLIIARDSPRNSVNITVREAKLARAKPDTELQTLQHVFTWDVLLKLLSISAGVLLMTMVEVSWGLRGGRVGIRGERVRGCGSWYGLSGSMSACQWNRCYLC